MDRTVGEGLRGEDQRPSEPQIFHQDRRHDLGPPLIPRRGCEQALEWGVGHRSPNAHSNVPRWEQGMARTTHHSGWPTSCSHTPGLHQWLDTSGSREGAGLRGPQHGGPHSSQLNGTPQGVPRALAGQEMEVQLRPQSHGKSMAEPGLELSSPDYNLLDQGGLIPQ